MKNFILIINLILVTKYNFSQNYIDILKVNAITTPYNTFDTSASETKINQLDADFTIPIKISDRFAVITGLAYENIQTKLFAGEKMKRFGSVTLKSGVNKQFNDNWSGTMVLLPKIASDYVSVGNKDFQIGAIAIMKYKKRDNLNYKFGLYCNTELFGPFFVPMAGMYYLSQDKKFETNIMLPLQADVNYKLLPFMNVGCNFNGQIRSYHLTDVTPANHSTYVTRSTNEFYAYLKFDASKNISIQTKAGQSVERSYKVYDENDKVSFGLPALFIGPERQQLNSNFTNGMIFQMVFLYRFNLNKN